jgi:hypothetical protein
MNFHLPTPVDPFWLTPSNSEKTCYWLYLEKEKMRKKATVWKETGSDDPVDASKHGQGRKGLR